MAIDLRWLRFFAQFTMLASATFANTMSNSPNPHHSKYILYVGTYGKGIYAFRYQTGDASLEPLSMVGEIINSSWVDTDATHKNLFAVSEVPNKKIGAVVSFAIDHATGKLTPINSQSSEGFDPCHLSIDKTGKVLVAANYSSGSAASYPLSANGEIGARASLMAPTGTGPNKERQEAPHAHEAVFSASNSFVYVPDLGLDLIHIYKVDLATAKLSPADPPEAKAAPGMGPRHMVFSPNDEFAYVINELKPAVTVWKHDPASGKLNNIQTISTVAETQTGEVGPAEILISKSGKFVYASNRGPGTIAVYAVDHATGKLALVQIAETGGTWPRGVEFDPSGNLLFAGDQKSDKFVTFHIDHATGKLTLTGKSYEVPSPVSFVFVPVD